MIGAGAEHHEDRCVTEWSTDPRGAERLVEAYDVGLRVYWVLGAGESSSFTFKPPQQESNLHYKLRKPAFYPLNYGEICVQYILYERFLYMFYILRSTGIFSLV